MRNKFLLLVTLLLSFTASSQIISDVYLRYFQVYKIDQYINCRWKTGIDFTCSDVALYYGTDSNDMNEIYFYPGVCGSNTEEKEYEYLHISPASEILFYQLRLGTFGNSSILSIDNSAPMSHFVSPNPFHSTCQFITESPGELIDVVVYNSLSEKVWEKRSTKSGDLQDLSSLKSGLYWYSIQTINNRLYSGKLVKK